MPWTGYDPQSPGGDIDTTGGGMDPSYAWLLAPGGRFNGDVWDYLEYQAALDPSKDRISKDGIGPLSADPNYSTGLESLIKRGILAKILALHDANVRNHSGVGNAPINPTDAAPNSLFSGPGAAYGPLSGPTRGLFDQGTMNIHDGPEGRGSLGTVGGVTDTGKHHGGGGGYNGPSGFATPASTGFQPSFLAWQPGNAGTPRFTGPANQPAGVPPVPPREGPMPPPGGFQGRWRGPNRGGQPTSTEQTPASAGGGSSSSGGTEDLKSLEEIGKELGLSPEDMKALAGLGSVIAGPAGTGTRATGQFGSDGPMGYDTNMMSSNAPNSLRDPSYSITDTAGMPNPTPFMQNPGETRDDYMTRLHDAGFGMDDISKLLGMQGDWGGVNGAGVVVGNPGGGGYHFANQDPVYKDQPWWEGPPPKGGTGANDRFGNWMGGIGNILNSLINLY